ncbi:hypothetical protein C8J56DRAFT_1049750 [Mycena floridula]|nr:hypothetical protein C8J56DRAFT_1049750 [Mycena floridula]
MTPPCFLGFALFQQRVVQSASPTSCGDGHMVSMDHAAFLDSKDDSNHPALYSSSVSTAERITPAQSPQESTEG